MAYKVADITRIVSENLGKGVVDVELNPEHYVRGIDAALKILSRWLPQYGYQVYSAVTGGAKYKITARNVIDVVDVSFFNSGLRFEEAPYYTRWSDRSIELGDMHSTQRVFGDEPEWTSLREVNQATGDDDLYVYAHFTMSSFVDTFARIPTHFCARFAWFLDPTDDKNVGVNRIPQDLRQWVEDYATARCRSMLGDARGKFGGNPGADDGALLPNDGGMQVQRAQLDMDRLEKDLQNRQRQMPLLWV